ncbi:MAG: TIM barrel protein [Bryobacterales bacterium]|nr:TIM barrel protein [Bryobacterales bacterium]
MTDSGHSSRLTRRHFIASAAIAGTALRQAVKAAPAGGPKLSIRVEPIFPGLPLPEQLERVAAAGYQGFEFGDWRAQNPELITKLKNRLGLTCVYLVGNRSVNPPGMGLCDPAERAGFLTEIRASLEAAKRFEADKLVVLSGYKVDYLSREEQHESIVEGLKQAADFTARDGVTLIIEPINTLAKIEPLNPTGDNHANYFLDKPSEAFEIVRKVDSPYVKVLYDLYHAQIMEGNLIETIREHHSQIGHIHVADVPKRHEPGTGEIHFANVFRAVYETAFDGFIGAEYIPLADAAKTLADMKALSQKAFHEARP